MIWVNQIVQGVLLGGYYALIACGLSFMFGVMRIINLAHGDLAVLAAFLVWVIAGALGISPFLALVAVLPIMAMVGWLLQRLMLERSLRAGMLVPLLSTFGLAIVIENLLFQQFGADTRSLAPNVGDLAYDAFDLGGGIYVGYLSALIFVVAVGVLVGLQFFLRMTTLGREIRAVAEDADAAELVGINARAVYAAAAAIAVVTVGIGGTALGLRATFDAYAGPAQLIFAFEAVVIGGLGSLWGTIVGGVVLGVAQSIGAQLDPHGFLIAGHVVFLLVLAVRPFVASISLGRRRAAPRTSAP
ncbi:MAG TPA: branched-chain amino acid ABC transporter permease [Hyphomicrobiales bacterium]|nr:branched-chain amino acid ABC transporter permease [Hyphomicrobiales bacterium]